MTFVRTRHAAKPAPPPAPAEQIVDPPKAPLGETCGGCIYWSRIEGSNGVCKRYPPILVNMVSLSPGRLSPASWAFPQIDAADWCGDYKKQMP